MVLVADCRHHLARLHFLLRTLKLGKRHHRFYLPGIVTAAPSSSPRSSAFIRKAVCPASPICVALFVTLLCVLFSFTAVARPYAVKAGDTLERIAQRELGQAKRWSEIAQANRLTPPYALKIGQRLELPDNLAFQHPTILTPLPPPQPRATNTPAPAFPPVPPGNTISTNPFSTVTQPVKNDVSSSEDFQSLLWKIPLAILIALLFEALNLRISCWFSLVETTYFRCLKLALYLLLLGIVSFFAGLLLLLIGGAIGIAAKTEPWSIAAVFLTIPIALVTWFILSLLVIKRTLDCKWRSVVTLLIMSWFVTWLLGIILALSTMSLGPITQLLSQLPKP
jgi:LysM repeat protein